MIQKGLGVSVSIKTWLLLCCSFSFFYGNTYELGITVIWCYQCPMSSGLCFYFMNTFIIASKINYFTASPLLFSLIASLKKQKKNKPSATTLLSLLGINVPPQPQYLSTINHPCTCLLHIRYFLLPSWFSHFNDAHRLLAHICPLNPLFVSFTPSSDLSITLFFLLPLPQK